MNEYALWGTPPGESDEVILLSWTTDYVRIQQGCARAAQEGFTNVRIQTLDGDVPDFARTIQV